MPFHFHRVIRIAPGVRITLGRRGMSSSAGVSGIDLSYVTSTVTSTTTRRRRRRTSAPVTVVNRSGASGRCSVGHDMGTSTPAATMSHCRCDVHCPTLYELRGEPGTGRYIWRGT